MRCYFFILIIFLTFSISSNAQFCTGSLGENIFLEGDFGTGAPNLLSPNPNVAPGYDYTFNVPPFDGQYVLTNNTASWGGLFDTWLGIGDNSFDPNGYMMVVNASNSPGLFYEQTVTGLCENTLYEFSADIINLIKVGTPDHSDPNVSFLLNGVAMFDTGNIPKTNNWSTFGFTFTTQVGQQSLTLSLRNNAPGGIGNDLAIDNIFFRACGPETLIAPGEAVVSICEEDTPVELEATLMGNQYVTPAFQWQESLDEGLTWTDIVGATAPNYTPFQSMEGFYYYRFLVADGVNNLTSDKCRVNSNPKIIEIYPTHAIQIDTILCDGQSLMIGNSVYDESGIYRDTFSNFFGCDSIITTNLTVTSDPIFTANLITTSACPNQTNGSVSIENLTGGMPPFSFTFEGIDVGTTPFFSDLLGGEIYTVIIKDASDCRLELSALVEQSPGFMSDLIVVQPCPNEMNGSISIENISGGKPPYTIFFEGINVDTTSFFPELSGGVTYTVLVEDANGCSFEQSASLEEPAELVADLIAISPCPNQMDGHITIENVSGGTAPYRYIFDGIAVDTMTFFPDLPGDATYTIIIQDANGCSIERSAFLEQPSSLTLELGRDQVVELGETVFISPFYDFIPSDYNWQPMIENDSLDFELNDELEFVPTASQEVTLELFIENGCSVSDALFIEVIDVRKVYLPNVFSPNGDGINDFFTVFADTENVVLVEELKVFNRWGAVIFDNNDFLPNLRQGGWDGNFNEEPIGTGVYIYTATVRFVDGKVILYSGDISVLR